MKKTILIFLFFFNAVFCFAAQRHSALLENAEKSFVEGNYNKTIEIYETLIRTEKINNPYLYYNLSNAYYRKGEFGKAVLNIERAYLLKPGDKDIKYNKKFLEEIAGIGTKNFFADTYDSVINMCSLNGMTVIAAFLVLASLLFGVLSFGIKYKNAFKKTAVILFCFFVVFAILTAIKVKHEIIDTVAVTIKDSDIRSGPGENNLGLYKLSQGRKVYAERSNKGWTFIKIKPEKISGWIENSNIENINKTKRN